MKKVVEITDEAHTIINKMAKEQALSKKAIASAIIKHGFNLFKAKKIRFNHASVEEVP
jgi:hypothetical protein